MTDSNANGAKEEHSDSYNDLKSIFKPKVADAFDKLIVLDLMTLEELDDRAQEGLKEFSEDEGVEFLKFFQECALDYVVGKSAYICGLFKHFRLRKATGMAPIPIKGPSLDKIQPILDRTGYSLEVTLGQRKYGGPPPGWGDKAQPVQGHELFIGKLPRGVFEDTLIPIFEEHGEIWDLRVMMDPATGDSKGYGFVTYVEKKDAGNAAKALNDYEIISGKHIKVNLSVSNVRLYIGNLPKSKTKDEIREALNEIIDGIQDVIVYNVADNPKLHNRGFCFVDFANHKDASAAKRKMAIPKYGRLFNAEVIVDWADPQETPSADVMSKVRVLYVRNITSEVTEDLLKEIFSVYGELEKVKMIKDYAFIHYASRESALEALKDAENLSIGKNKVEIQLAKPVTEQARQRRFLRQERGAFRGAGAMMGGAGFYGAGGMGGMGAYGGGYMDQMAFAGGYGGGMGYSGFDDWGSGDDWGSAAAAMMMMMRRGGGRGGRMSGGGLRGRGGASFSGGYGGMGRGGFGGGGGRGMGGQRGGGQRGRGRGGSGGNNGGVGGQKRRGDFAESQPMKRSTPEDDDDGMGGTAEDFYADQYGQNW